MREDIYLIIYPPSYEGEVIYPNSYRKYTLCKNIWLDCNISLQMKGNCMLEKNIQPIFLTILNFYTINIFESDSLKEQVFNFVRH